MGTWQFRLDMAVRDYECDMEGIVNNGVYMHYLEHARHEHLKHLGLDFGALVAKGINLVVVRVEADYKAPLRSGDAFWVGNNIGRVSRLKFEFAQDVVRASDHKVCLQARVIGVAMDGRGRPFFPPDLEALIPAADPTSAAGA